MEDQQCEKKKRNPENMEKHYQQPMTIRRSWVFEDHTDTANHLVPSDMTNHLPPDKNGAIPRSKKRSSPVVKTIPVCSLLLLYGVLWVQSGAPVR